HPGWKLEVGRRMKRLGIVLLALVAGHSAAAQEIAPASVVNTGPVEIGRFSDRTVSVALSIDRDRAEVIAFTVKDLAFERAPDVAAPAAYDAGGGNAQIE